MGNTQVMTFEIENYGTVNVPVASKENRGKKKYVEAMLRNAIRATYELVIEKTAKTFSDAMDGSLPSTEESKPHKHVLVFKGRDHGLDYGADETILKWSCEGCGVDYLATRAWFYKSISKDI